MRVWADIKVAHELLTDNKLMGLGTQLRPRGGRCRGSGDSRVCPKLWVLQQVPCSEQGMGKLEGCEEGKNPR